MMSAEQSLSKTSGHRDGASCPASPEGRRALWIRDVALEQHGRVSGVPCPKLDLG